MDILFEAFTAPRDLASVPKYRATQRDVFEKDLKKSLTKEYNTHSSHDIIMIFLHFLAFLKNLLPMEYCGIIINDEFSREDFRIWTERAHQS